MRENLPLRVMIRPNRALAVTACVALFACASHAPRVDTNETKATVAAFAASCERSGYPRGTAEHARCTLDLVNRAFPAPPPSDTVNCTSMGGGTVTCTRQ